MKKAFTLIELLVVIAIIAILAAILFPVFAQAKQAAKKSSDLSNMKQIGLAIMMYNADNSDTYSQAYWYKNDAGDLNGYWQWSASVMPYVKSVNIFQSPGDPNGGLTPTNPPCANINETTPNATPCDSQVAKISYTVNAALMPRKRRTIDPANVVNEGAVDVPASTILVAPFSRYQACVNDSSFQQSNQVKNKSHRSVNAVMLANGGKWRGERPEEFPPAMNSVYAITEARAKASFAGCNTAPSADAYLQIAYIDPIRFGDGSNYTFGDGHAKFYKFSTTINHRNYLWGKRMYSAGGIGILDQAGINVD